MHRHGYETSYAFTVPIKAVCETLKQYMDTIVYKRTGIGKVEVYIKLCATYMEAMEICAKYETPNFLIQSRS